MLAAQQPYHLDRAALADLDLDDADVNLLVGVLTLAGDVSADLAVPYDRLAYFRDPRHALDYTVEGFEDYSTDVFFLLHDAATELAAGTAEITERLEEHADDAAPDVPRRAAGRARHPGRHRRGDLPRAVRRRRGRPGRRCWRRSSRRATRPGGSQAEPADRRFRRLYRRLARFALLAAKLRLTGEETEVAFRDQDLVGKFPEPLALPPGFTRVDALLPSGDGHVYLFDGAPAGATPPGPSSARTASAVAAEHPVRAVRRCSPGVDAAFVDADGAEWLVGHDRSGRPCEFCREAGTSRWIATPRTWGLIRNNFADPERIDTAFRDAEGKTYLFSGDQYVRYSGGRLRAGRRGLPPEDRGELGRRRAARARCRRDSRRRSTRPSRAWTAGPTCSRAGSTPRPATRRTRPVGERWGRVRNAFLDAGRIDAAYAEDSALYLLLGDQVVRYVDCIENAGVQVDEGYPRRLEQHFPDLPAEFETRDRGGLRRARRGRAAVQGRPDGHPPGDRIVRRVDRRWAQLGPVLPTGTVDAAFVGLDGKTYLFSGDRYVRYSGADYSHVDAGYPRLIARDWGGMTSVDVAFVLDGRTHLFGTAGTLFRIPVADDFDVVRARARTSAPGMCPRRCGNACSRTACRSPPRAGSRDRPRNGRCRSRAAAA